MASSIDLGGVWGRTKGIGLILLCLPVLWCLLFHLSMSPLLQHYWSLLVSTSHFAQKN